ncbi:hypothetical protein XENOCAPTIV_002096, partial [Xenoophorus captivus]
YFTSHLLAFSSNLDEHNPDVAEWRLDVSRVIRSSLIQVKLTHFFKYDIETFKSMLLPINDSSKVFTLRPGVQVTVYAAHLSAGAFKLKSKRSPYIKPIHHMGLISVHCSLHESAGCKYRSYNFVVLFTPCGACLPVSAAPLVDTSENHSGSAMLMLLSVVVAGLAVFVIYKFKRKIPGLNVYAQMQNDKEPEMMSPANPSEATPSSQQDLVPSLEILDTECNSRPIGKMPLVFSVPPISFYTLHCLFHTILPLHCCFMTLILCFLLFLSKMVQTTGELNRYSAVGP